MCLLPLFSCYLAFSRSIMWLCEGILEYFLTKSEISNINKPSKCNYVNHSRTRLLLVFLEMKTVFRRRVIQMMVYVSLENC